MSPYHPAAEPRPPDEDEDGSAIVGPEHDPRGAQERPQDLHQAWGQLVHLVKEEEGATAGSEVPLDPALKILLQGRGKNWRGSGDTPLTPDLLPRPELIPFPGGDGLPERTPFVGLGAKQWP